MMPVDLLDDAEIRSRLCRHSCNIDETISRPVLRTLIWEATRRCNLACSHCCIPPGDWRREAELDTRQVQRIFAEIADDLDPRTVHVAITGGEPTLRKDLVEIVKYLVTLSFRTVSVDSNGLNYARDISLLDRLVDAGMSAGTVGVDGLREGYRRTRGVDRFREVLQVLRHAVAAYPDRLYLTTFTVANPDNVDEIPELMSVLAEIGVRYARIGPVSEIGRASGGARRHRLQARKLRGLLEWIARAREECRLGTFPMEVELSDDGWCGPKHELLTRDQEHTFFCATGITIGGLLYDGKVSACPHLPRDLGVQGDALTDRFMHVWNHRFQAFRNKDWLKTGKCRNCDQWEYCRGGPMHYRDADGKMKRCFYDAVRRADRLPCNDSALS